MFIRYGCWGETEVAVRSILRFDGQSVSFCSAVVRRTGVMDFRKYRCPSAGPSRVRCKNIGGRCLHRFRLAGPSSRSRGGSEIRDRPADTDVNRIFAKTRTFLPVRETRIRSAGTRPETYRRRDNDRLWLMVFSTPTRSRRRVSTRPNGIVA